MRALPDAFDAVEFFYYLAGFWLFLFKPRFREAVLERWRSRSGFQHIATAFEIVLPTSCGLVIPALIIWGVFCSGSA